MSKHIYIYSPSSAVRDKMAFRRGVKRLKALGHEVEIDPDALRSHQRFAGDDATRLAAIERAARSGADVALISRGGYGLTRLLPQLPYDTIAEAITQGQHWVGLSDFTALQMGLMAHLQRRNGRNQPWGKEAVTWAGPALGEDFGADPAAAEADQPVPDDIMEACFDDLLSGLGEGSGWRLPVADCRALAQGFSPASNATNITNKSHDSDVANKSIQSSDDGQFFVKNAVLWGGNLSVLTSLVGTPWLPQVEQGILFLEDVNEHPYRIERMLTQLLGSGILAQQQAVVLGQFNRYKAVPHDKGFKLSTVVSWLRAQLAPLGIPVLTDLPFGHVPTKVLLPVGKTVDMYLSDRDALLFWE